LHVFVLHKASDYQHDRTDDVDHTAHLVLMVRDGTGAANETAPIRVGYIQLYRIVGKNARDRVYSPVH
jgi:hypothetical protein